MTVDKYEFRVINWIASYPKSGNTWVRFLYQAHQLGSIDINANSRVTHSDSFKWPYSAVLPWPVETLPLEVLPHVRSAALMMMMASKSGPPFVCKTHCANSMINKTRLIPYEMTRSSVYIVRDPRDIVVSYARHFKETYDKTIELIKSPRHVMGKSHHIPQYPASWSINVESWTQDEAWEYFGCIKPLVIKYEDLLKDTKKHFLKILKLWEVKPRNVDKVIEMCRLSELRKQEKKHGFLEAKYEDVPFFGRGGLRYTTELTKGQVAQIIKDHGPVMEKMGYI